MSTKIAQLDDLNGEDDLADDPGDEFESPDQETPDVETDEAATLPVEELIAPPLLGNDTNDWQESAPYVDQHFDLAGPPPHDSSYGSAPSAGYSADLVSPSCGCPSCAGYSHGAACDGPQCGCGQPCLGKYWFRADYLHWWGSGMDLPPLVTTSPDNTSADEAGQLGLPNTRILFGGNDEILDDSRSGVRIRLGMQLDDCSKCGLECEYFGFEDTTAGFFAAGDGTPILARPFFNLVPLFGLPGEDAQLIGFENAVNGFIRVNLRSEFHSAGVRVRMNVGGSHCGGACGSCGSCSSRGGASLWCFDFLAGYRYLELNERIGIEEQIINPEDQFDLRERFDGRNEFHGLELGCLYELKCKRVTLELLSKVAVGNGRQTVTIDGSTVRTAGGIVEAFPGALLAQRTNIGTYTFNELAFVPEMGLTVGYQLTKFLSATFGYSMVYWSNVARPGLAIDRDLNPNLIPPEIVPVSSPLRPRFTPNGTDFWAHGINFGFEYRI